MLIDQISERYPQVLCSDSHVVFFPFPIIVLCILSKIGFGVRRKHVDLVLASLGLAAPVVGIGIEQKARIICERNIKDQCEEEHHIQGSPLQPSCVASAIVIRSKSNKGEENDENHFESLTIVHGVGCEGVGDMVGTEGRYFFRILYSNVFIAVLRIISSATMLHPGCFLQISTFFQ